MGVIQEEQEANVEALLELCREGREEEVAELIRAGGVGVDSHDDDDVTPLQAAAAAGQLPLVKRLLKMGADMNLCNQYGWTPIIHAAYNGHVDLLCYLVESGANLMHRTYLGISALTLAAARGNLKMIRKLIDLGLEECVVDDEADIDLTPVMAAAYQSQDTVAKLLLSRGANVNITMNETGLTALMLAAMFGHVTTVQLLLDSAADPNAETLLHQTALSLASERNRRETRDLLQSRTFQSQDQSKEKGNIMEAIEAGQFNRAKTILKDDVHAANFIDPDTGKTPLMAAVTLGKMDLVEILVVRGAALNHQSRKNGLTALMLAIAHEKPGIAKFLIASGANIDVRDHEGRNAFDFATQVNAGQDLLSVLGQKTGIPSLKPEPHNNRTPERNSMTLNWKQLPKKFAKKLRKKKTKRRDDSRRSLDETRLSTAHRQSRGLPDLTWEKQLFADPLLSLGDCFRTLDSILLEHTGDKIVPLSPSQKTVVTKSVDGLLPQFSLPGGDTLEEPPRSVAAANALLMGSGKEQRARRFHRGFKSTSRLNLKGSDLFLQQETSSFGKVSSKYSRNSLSRPHSYHDPGLDKRYLAPGVHPVPALMLTKAASRPHSFHDHNEQLELQASGGLPVTPTRKSFGFFSGGQQPELSKFASAPFLHGCSPGSSYGGDSLKRKSAKPSHSLQRLRVSPDHCPEINAFLKSIDLEHYGSVFHEQEIDLDTFLTLTDADLLELGIEDMGSRNRIITTLLQLTKAIPKSPSVVDLSL